MPRHPPFARGTVANPRGSAGVAERAKPPRPKGRAAFLRDLDVALDERVLDAETQRREQARRVLARKVVRLAIAGNAQALQLLIERLVPKLDIAIGASVDDLTEQERAAARARIDLMLRRRTAPSPVPPLPGHQQPGAA